MRINFERKNDGSEKHLLPLPRRRRGSEGRKFYSGTGSVPGNSGEQRRGEKHAAEVPE